MKAIFLDRDGVLNPYMPEDYIKSPTQWRWQENALNALRLLHMAKFHIFIVTNQSCINRKYVSYRTIFATHEKAKYDLSTLGIHNIYFHVCHHLPEDACLCRKPLPSLIQTICTAYPIQRKETWLIGDSPTDMQAGINAGLKVAGVLTGNPKMPEYVRKHNLPHFDGLWQAVKALPL